jgi:hypothetical protein
MTPDFLRAYGRLYQLGCVSMKHFRDLPPDVRQGFIDWHVAEFGGDFNDAWDTALDMLAEDESWEDPYGRAP